MEHSAAAPGPSKSVLVAKAKRPLGASASAPPASAPPASASASSRRLFTIPSSTQAQHQQQGSGLPNLFEAERRNVAREQPSHSARTPTASTPFLDAFASMTSSDSYQAVVAAASTPATQQQQHQQHRKVPARTTRQPTQKPSKLIEDAEKTVLVSHKQKGNRVLDFINNVPWKFADVLPDFVVGRHNCILFLSIRFHLLHPNYILGRMAELKRMFRVRVLLCHVDIEDKEGALQELARTSIINDWSMLCAFTSVEAARYIETFKAYENASADIIKERSEKDNASLFSSILLLIRSVNKTDVATLSDAFRTLEKVSAASVSELASLPGIGLKKATRIYESFHADFSGQGSKLSLSADSLSK